MARPELLGIPPELRLKILRYCMVVGVLPLTTSPFNFRSASSQILRLSKQFHNEALPILYGENIFYFGDGMMMESKLMCINTHAKSMIRHVCLGDSVNLTTKKVFLKSLKGLRGFSILIAKIGMLHLSDPKRNKVFAVEETPPRTIVQDFSWKYRGVEVGVVLCFVSDAQDVLVCFEDSR